MLSNADGDRVLMTYNSAKHTFGMDRRRSGLVDFSSDFPSATLLRHQQVNIRLYVCLLIAVVLRYLMEMEDL